MTIISSKFLHKLTMFLLLSQVAISASADSVQKPAIMSELASKFLLTGSAKLADDTGYVAVGLYGHIVVSNDGQQWHQAKSPTQILLTNVFFLDAEQGWAVGHDAVILHTSDGGANWDLQYDDPIPGGDLPKPLLDIYFKDKLNGFAVGAYGLMLKTKDGGENWESINTEDLYDKLENLEMEPEPNFNSLIPLNNKIMVSGELGTILLFDPIAEDEESRWEVIESPYQGSFFGANNTKSSGLYLYGLRGKIYNSKDQGKSWSKIETGVVTSIYDAVELANDTVVFLGSNGTILSLAKGDVSTKKHPYPGYDGFVSGEVEQANKLILFGNAGVKKITLETIKIGK